MASTVHVLVIPIPIQGHITPMVQFSKRLASRGVGATVITPASTSSCVQINSSLVRIESIPDVGGGGKPDGIDAINNWMKDLVSDNLVEITSKATDSGCFLTAVVYDSIMPWVADFVHRLGLQATAFNSQSCAVYAIYHHADQGNLAAQTKGSIVSLPSMPPLGLDDLPSFFSDNNCYSSLLKHVLGRNWNTQKAYWLLFNTFNELEIEDQKKWYGI